MIADQFGDIMALGKKLFEEKGKMTMFFIDGMEKDSMTMKQSFESEVHGIGDFPSGKNMGSGVIWMHANGKAGGKWHGMLVTKDNDMVVWKGSSQSKMENGKIKGIMVISFWTKSEKLSWMNEIIAVADISGDMNEVKTVANQWE